MMEEEEVASGYRRPDSESAREEAERASAM